MQQFKSIFLHVQGEVLGITRFGLAKMKESVLMLASVSNALKNSISVCFYCSLRKLVTISLMLHSMGNVMRSMVNSII